MSFFLWPEDKNGTLNCTQVGEVVCVGAAQRIAPGGEVADPDWQIVVCLKSESELRIVGLTEGVAKEAVRRFWAEAKGAKDV